MREIVLLKGVITFATHEKSILITPAFLKIFILWKCCSFFDPALKQISYRHNPNSFQSVQQIYPSQHGKKGIFYR